MGVYRLEVTSPGCEIAYDEVEVWSAGSASYAFINLKPESAGKSATPSGPPVLAPKAREAMEKALIALEGNDLKKGQQHLERAAALAPGHPLVHHLYGVVYLRLRQPGRAKASFAKATNLDPNFRQSFTATGMILYHEADYPGAIRELERGVGTDWGPWEAQFTLASAYYHERQYDKVRIHAEKAHELTKGVVAAVHLLLVQTLALLGERGKAARECESFLAHFPQDPNTQAARRLLEQLRKQETSAASISPVISEPELLAPAPFARDRLKPELPYRRWAPPDLDEVVPAVARDAACLLPEVLKAASRKVLLLPENLQRFTATERVEHTEIDPGGNPLWGKEQYFDYLVFLRKVGPGTLSVEDSRNQGRAINELPVPLTTGLSAVALLFHPYYAGDFEMRCEGLGDWRGQPAWQIHFRQREDRPARIRLYQTAMGRFPLRVKGRAWIAANTHQVLRLETDLVEAVKEIGLKLDHLVIEYQPVQFKHRNLRLWLPKTAEVFVGLGDRRYHHKHTFSDFLLFSVDVDHKVAEPKQP